MFNLSNRLLVKRNINILNTANEEKNFWLKELKAKNIEITENKFLDKIMSQPNITYEALFDKLKNFIFISDFLSFSFTSQYWEDEEGEFNKTRENLYNLDGFFNCYSYILSFFQLSFFEEENFFSSEYYLIDYFKDQGFSFEDDRQKKFAILILIAYFAFVSEFCSSFEEDHCSILCESWNVHIGSNLIFKFRDKLYSEEIETKAKKRKEEQKKQELIFLNYQKNLALKSFEKKKNSLRNQDLDKKEIRFKIRAILPKTIKAPTFYGVYNSLEGDKEIGFDTYFNCRLYSKDSLHKNYGIGVKTKELQKLIIAWDSCFLN